MIKRILHFIVVLFVPFVMMAQSTTSSMSGTAKSADGAPLLGATVTATHEPTGTVYRVQTRTNGVFDINNMNPGGPYTVEVSFINFETTRRSDLFLQLGVTSRQDFLLATRGTTLSAVTVSGLRRGGDLNSKGGTGTNIGRERLDNLPTVGRNLSDYLRAVPQAKITSSEGGISIAGQNNRLNSFYIDGAVNNDVFGLSASGTNGGQAGVAPISIDAIDQFNVVISPYDPSLGNFTGGGINAITRSGTNKTQGSVYLFYRNQDMAGKTPTGDKSAATKLNDFANKTYGFRVGGALIKNKLFYFLNGEIQRDVRPQPFDIANYTGNTKDINAIRALVDTLTRKYSYDPGNFQSNDEQVNAERISTKIDYNINNRNKLSVSYRYTNGIRYNTSGSNSTTINFYNNGYIFPTKTHSASAELNSTINNAMSNKLLVTYTDVLDDRNPIGNPFPRVTINDGSGRFVFGPDNSSTVNKLTTNNLGIFDRFVYNVGKHQISVGTDNEFTKAYNAFIQNTFGNYTYANLAAFYNNSAPTVYTYGFSQLDNRGDQTASAAKFSTMRLGLFAGDEYKASQNFTLNYGFRMDYYRFITQPATDSFTNNVAIPRFSQSYDLQGARSGLRPTIPVSISPRIGFTYKIPEENVTVRGGLGLFTGRIPLVWPGGIYNNNGINQGGYTASSTSNPAALNTIRFRPDPNNQWRPSEVGINVTKGGLNLISAEFKQPKIFRTSLAFDKKFGDGWNGTIEGLFTKNINEIYYTNINLLPPTITTAAVGGPSRTIYSAPNVIPLTGTTNPYDNAILLTNNKGDKGFSYNFTLTVDKRWQNGVSFNFNYNYGNSVVVNEATSSVNLSQWRFMETANGRNFITRSTSDFDQGHRIFSYISKKFTYANKNLATTLSLVYTGASGNHFSYVYGTTSVIRDDANSATTNDLIYIPTSGDIQNMVFLNNTVGTVTYTPAEQRAALETYIQNDKYLNNKRGEFANRNGSRLPFTHIFDFKIAQDVNVRVGKERYQFQISYDIFNASNLVNRDWGRNYFLANDQYAIISFAGYATVNGVANTPQYRFNPVNNTRPFYNVSTSVVPAYSARWISQLGLRFNFN